MQTVTTFDDTAVGWERSLCAFLNGRRRAKVLNMTTGDLTQEDDRIWYRYRGKGNKQGKRELPEPAYVATRPVRGACRCSQTRADCTRCSAWLTRHFR